MIDAILDEDISNRKRKIAHGRGIIEDMGDSCPAFGMIGTVIGLIVIMANLSDPSPVPSKPRLPKIQSARFAIGEKLLP